MINRQKIISILLISIIPLYLLSKGNGNEQTSKITEVKVDTEDILNTVLENGDKIDKIRKQKKESQTINNNGIMSSGNNAHNTYIENEVKNYYSSSLECSDSCGIVIRTWKSAKKYCSKNKGTLPSIKQIKNSYKYNKKECKDCSYWTREEALHPTLKRSYPRKKVKVYVQADADFRNYYSTSTYVATCVKK